MAISDVCVGKFRLDDAPIESELVSTSSFLEYKPIAMNTRKHPHTNSFEMINPNTQAETTVDVTIGCSRTAVRIESNSSAAFPVSMLILVKTLIQCQARHRKTDSQRWTLSAKKSRKDMMSSGNGKDVAATSDKETSKCSDVVVIMG